MGSGTRSRSASAKAAAIVTNSFEWAVCWLNPTPYPIAPQCAYSIAVNCFTKRIGCSATMKLARPHNSFPLGSVVA